MNRTPIYLLLCVLVGAFSAVAAAIPGLLNYQGRVLVGNTGFSGQAQFKFALVNTDGSRTYWLSSADGNLDSQPDSPITLTLNRGLYSLLVGDTNLANMAALPSNIFTNQPLFLRIWFNDGTNGFELLAPDHQLGSVAHAIIASTVEDGSITRDKLADGVLASTNVSGVFDSSQIPELDAAKIVSGQFPSDRLPDNVAYKDGDLVTLSNSVAALEASLGARITALSNDLANAKLESGSDLPAGAALVSSSAQDTNLLAKGYLPFFTVAAPSWTSGSTAGAPSPRYSHVSVWTGSELFVWGGSPGGGTLSASGALYDPATDQWRSVSTIDSPTARSGAVGVWMSTNLFLWGGNSAAGYTNSGGIYDPAGQSWTASTLSNVPAGRDGHSMVWTGSRVVVFGGRNTDGLLGDTAIFDPSTNGWSSVALPGGPTARFHAASSWTGDRLIVWGGEDASGLVANGAQLVFTNGVPSEWIPINPANAPSARTAAGSVWTGSRFLVWGGNNGSQLGDGAAYDPATDSWEPLPSAGAPSARSGHTALWTGSELVVFGGETTSGVTAGGGALNLATGSWRSLTGAGNPVARTEAGAAWTGTELVVFGGRSGATALASLQRLVPQPAWYFYRKP